MKAVAIIEHVSFAFGAHAHAHNVFNHPKFDQPWALAVHRARLRLIKALVRF